MKKEIRIEPHIIDKNGYKKITNAERDSIVGSKDLSSDQHIIGGLTLTGDRILWRILWSNGLGSAVKEAFFTSDELKRVMDFVESKYVKKLIIANKI